MKRRWLFGGAALVLATVTVLALVGLPADAPTPSGSPAPTSPLPELPEPPAEEAAAVRQASPLTADPKPITGWHEADMNAVTELPPYKEVVEGRVLVRVSPELRSLDIGDPISISVPQLDKTWRTVVEEVERGPGVARSLIGELKEGDGQRREFVITTGKRYTFAWLGTPAGSYQLVAPGEFGWLMPSANMDQHVDYSQPDYYIPGRDEPPPPFGTPPRRDVRDGLNAPRR